MTLLALVHPDDIANLLAALSTDHRIALFQHLPLEMESEIYDEISDSSQQNLSDRLDDGFLADVL